jgi:hypothetical protein
MHLCHTHTNSRQYEGNNLTASDVNEQNSTAWYAQPHIFHVTKPFINVERVKHVQTE